jgi:hypothetical protein
MPKNPYQLADLAYNAGFQKDEVELTRAVAAALGESGGNERALGDGGKSYGLWQIYIPAHPEYAKNPEQLYDPKTNADAAYKIYVAAGRNFGPFHAWSKTNDLRRAQLLIPATAGVKAWKLAHPAAAFGLEKGTVGKGAAAGVEAAAQSAIPGLSEAAQGVERARAWLTTPANLGRLAIGIGGIVVIIVGISVLLRPAAEQAVKIAGAVK